MLQWVELDVEHVMQVAKQWYDYERTSFNFVKKLSEPGFKDITFTHQTDFDENGLIYWIGTNARLVCFAIIFTVLYT